MFPPVAAGATGATDSVVADDVVGTAGTTSFPLRLRVI